MTRGSPPWSTSPTRSPCPTRSHRRICWPPGAVGSLSIFDGDSTKVMRDGATDAARQGLRGSGSPFDGAGKAAVGWCVTRWTVGIAASRSAVGPRLSVTESRGRHRCAMSASTSGRGAVSPNSGGSGHQRPWASATEPLARFITIAVEHGVKTLERLRGYLCSALSPDSEGGRDVRYERWMAKYCLPLGELDRERIAEIDRRLGLKLDGSPMARTPRTESASSPACQCNQR